MLTLRDHDPEKVAELACREPYVRESSVEEGNTLRLYVEDGPPRCRSCCDCWTAPGIGIASMSLSEPTLDDVFLRQTGRSLRDGEGAPGPERRRA